ncbi:S-adenosyl-L-methionine-dependent methyltransferase [Aspergillus ibericus CBS 121593]|uniref:S-adenosyl-L-methionine-dependent methyltransferase n=1 Tax=Aspergillus ibericus CBS 121593 TaxID=1448316 RepID=A0A395H5N0_9EURO|nr:S-adenosyl-L-methionine-dependent methyltransferase [Aspergillus ibericus CBS 121593]RAL03000.1 S-adenosyl-L-methionine-dependent methyltransferase [Aspergillus ibericus CBS 121593]
MVELNGNSVPASDSHAGKQVDEIAVSPTAPDQVANLAKSIGSLSKAFTAGEAGARLQLLEAADSLLSALETPRETILRYCWRNPTAFAAIETGINLGIFRHLSSHDRPVPITELATATGADILTLTTTERIMKHLNAVHAVTETGRDEYTSNNFTRTVANTRYADAFPTIAGTTSPAIAAIPAFLRQTHYQNPTNGLASPFQQGFHTKDSFFEFLARDPILSAQFNNLMSVYHQGRASWMDPGFYPVDRLLTPTPTDTDPNILLVDVGGGKGHDLNEFRTKWPAARGRLILQDQPAVLAEATGLHESIERMPHDFFTEQPCKGSRAYFLHSVLHDWPDDTCLKILAPLRAAMTPGYSRLLINENVIPDRGAHWQATGLDWVMMGDFAGAERTEAQWRGLLSRAGFRILKIWVGDAWSESLIECEVDA